VIVQPFLEEVDGGEGSGRVIHVDQSEDPGVRERNVQSQEELAAVTQLGNILQPDLRSDIDARPMTVRPFFGPVFKGGVPSPFPMLGRGEGKRVNPRFLKNEKTVIWGVIEST
jgi:hypothetical protein